MYFKFRKPKKEKRIPEQKNGILKIEVPHWAAEVRVFNCLLQPIAEIGKVKPDAQSKSGYSLEVELEPGAYQVQTSLEGKTESEWIPVNERKITEVSPKAWEKLKFTSASPIKDIFNSNKTQSTKAAELSLQETWTHPAAGGNSRLFLFVRTLDPKTYGETFSDGLQLLSETGEVVTDFSDGIKKNKRQGWMAFNADLPSGGYVLRRGRRGVRLRHQVFYLCDGWETQIFLSARRYASLSTWSLNMARLGNGFQPMSEAVLASEAITDNLRYSSSGLFLLQNERIRESINVLLDEKMENPWLGILAAHAILRLREQTENFQLQLENLRSRKASEKSVAPLPTHLEAEISEAQDYFVVLEQKVKPFLQRAIGEHPDVRALMLSNDFAADKPFDFPPSLLAGLQRVQAHSLLFADTILLDSLTDYVIDSLVVDAPWSAWRRLAGQPKSNFYSSSKKLQIKQSGVTDFSVSTVLSQTAAPRTPVYRLAEDDEASPQNVQRTSAEMIMQDAPMIQKVKERVMNYVKDYEESALRDPIFFNSMEEINKVLAQVTPEEVSQNFGIPLSRTEESLKILHSQAAAGNIQAADEPVEASPPAFSPSSTQSLATVQQAILEYALMKFGKTESEGTGTTRTLPKFTIREIVNKIQSEADRLSVAALLMFAQGSAVPSDVLLPSADRLYRIAEDLLKHADFVLVTDSTGKILYGNGSFLLLISPKYGNRAKMTEQQRSEMRLAKQKEWGKILEAAPVGLREIENTYEAKDWRKWKLSRTEIEDQAANRSISYLNILRLAGVSPLDEETLREIDSATASLMFYAPSLIYGSIEDLDVDEGNLLKTIKRLEEQVKQNQ